MFTKNNNLKLQRKIDEQINIYSHCNNCSFKKFATIDDKEISDLSKKI